MPKIKRRQRTVVIADSTYRSQLVHTATAVSIPRRNARYISLSFLATHKGVKEAFILQQADEFDLFVNVLIKTDLSPPVSVLTKIDSRTALHYFQNGILNVNHLQIVDLRKSPVSYIESANLSQIKLEMLSLKASEEAQLIKEIEVARRKLRKRAKSRRKDEIIFLLKAFIQDPTPHSPDKWRIKRGKKIWNMSLFFLDFRKVFPWLKREKGFKCALPTLNHFISEYGPLVERRLTLRFTDTPSKKRPSKIKKT